MDGTPVPAAKMIAQAQELLDAAFNPIVQD
jgi:hypothetical protein